MRPARKNQKKKSKKKKKKKKGRGVMGCGANAYFSTQK
jgi:hypothetical protein